MSEWGQGVVNNSIGWGQGKDNTTNGWGTVYETSNSGDTALEIALVAPVNSVAPDITGTAEVGQTLTCSTGTWSGSPTSYAYQWKRAGVNIGGATNSTYVLVAADEGESIKCTVTATNGAGSASADSNTVTPTWEADAQAFITAASITDPTQQAAVNQLVLDLKGYSLWTKMKGIWPFIGGSASSHKWNLRDPRDLDAAFRMVFNGGWTHSATGALPNGTNAYAAPVMNIRATCSDTSHSFGIYSRTASTAGTQVYGVWDNSVGGSEKYLHHNVSGGNFISGDISTLATYTAAPTTGLINCSRTANNSFKTYRNGSVLSTNTSVSALQLPDFNFTFGARYRANALLWDFYDTHEIAFAYISDGLSDTDVSNLATAVNTMQTSLSRNV